jgi:hopene-associated glycosyltransferase HpnB
MVSSPRCLFLPEMEYSALAASISLVIWLYLLLGRGFFWRVNLALRDEAPPTERRRRIVAIVPARNEAEVIGVSIQSLLNQDLEPSLEVIVVNDNSGDDTVAVARTAGERSGRSRQLTILSGKPLEPGWTGKLWALSQGVELAAKLNPDYFLFTDADIKHDTSSVRHLLAIAERYGCDLASLMVKLECRSFAEKALIPAFVFFFFQLYPPRWIASTNSRTAGAAGGCVLIRPVALARIGGLKAIRGAVIDDCTLARAVKRTGGRLWLGLIHETCSIRSYGSFNEIGRVISRTAFSQLHHSFLLLLATQLGLFVVYVVPPLSLLTGRPVPLVLGTAGWLLMWFTYWPMVKFYGLSRAWALALPAVAIFYGAATLRSALLYCRGKGGEWKNRAQDALG